MKYILLLLSVFTFSQYSWAIDDFLNFGDKDFAKEKTEKSKWIIRTGIEYLKYTSTFPAFDGKHEAFENSEEADVWGYGLYFGRELYLGKGLSTTLTLGAAYHKTITKEVGQAARDIEYDVSSSRRNNQVITYEAMLSLNYLFDNKVVDLQPFIEGGLGMGNARVEKYYSRVSVPDANSGEEYDVVSEDVFAYSKISIGLNIIAFDGLISYFKVSTMLMNVSERNTKGDSVAFGTTTRVNYDTSDKDQSETMTSASLGMGYMF